MSIPKWRYIRYTDEGCALYQCLSCYNDWDSRTAPGWFNTTRSIPSPVEDGTNYYIEIEPEYTPAWTLCPYCGVQWEGAVRCDVDNEYMYGPRRLERYNKTHQSLIRQPQPQYTGRWWAIQELEICINCDDRWETKQFARISCIPAKRMLYLLKEARKEAERENEDWIQYEVQLVVKHAKPLSGYEIKQ